MISTKQGRLGILCTVLLSSACAPTTPEYDLSPQDISALCRVTLDNYFARTDRHDWTVLRETFSEDAVVTLRDGTYTGVEELTEYFLARDPQPNIIHHLTTASFERTGSDAASGIVYILIQGETSLPDGERQAMMYSGYYEDEYSLRDGNCKITQRTLTPRFTHSFAD